LTRAGGIGEATLISTTARAGSVRENALECLHGNVTPSDASHGESACIQAAGFHSLAVGLRLAKAYHRRYGAGPRIIT
ncbi:MAG TPA: hypothetical protein VG963_06880, partial [Polyangiaceae bacterium]|nr:hypothetical protein [Polyangiaceae bacterium]